LEVHHVLSVYGTLRGRLSHPNAFTAAVERI
jgi:hypothetical protein